MKLPIFHQALYFIIITMCCVIEPCVAQEQAKRDNPFPLFPLTKGAKWTYSNATTLTAGKRLTFIIAKECVGVEHFNGKICYKVETYQWSVGQPQDKKFPTFEYYFLSDDSLFDSGQKSIGAPVDRDGDGFARVLHTPPKCILKSPSDNQQDWTIKWTDYIRFKVFNSEVELNLVQFNDSIQFKNKEIGAVCTMRKRGLLGAAESTQWYARNIGLIKEEVRDIVGKVWSVTELVEFTEGNKLIVNNIYLADSTIEKEASSEIVEALPGVITEFKKTRTIVREINLSTTTTAGIELEDSVQLDLFALKNDLTGRVKASIERSIGERMSDSETREQSVKIDGDKLQKARIVWIDIFKKGNISVTNKGALVQIPFVFPIGTKLVVRTP
jgi:hypothetical protein